ncbi:type IV secretory system conjugative DNA transfer family protein [Escherichia coli]
MDYIYFAYFSLKNDSTVAYIIASVIAFILGWISSSGFWCKQFVLLGIPKSMIAARKKEWTGQNSTPGLAFFIDCDSPADEVLKIRNGYYNRYRLAWCSLAVFLVILTGFLVLEIYTFGLFQTLDKISALNFDRFYLQTVIFFILGGIIGFVHIQSKKPNNKSRELARINDIQDKARRKAAQRGNSLTDIRDVSFAAPAKFSPLEQMDKFSPGDRVFLGFNGSAYKENSPISVTRRFWNTANIQIIGAPGSGKTKMATNCILQCVRDFGDSCLFFDPKNDEHAPQVLHNNLPAGKFVKLDLRAGTPPQINPFGGLSYTDLKNLIINCFGMQESGKESDFYKLMQQDAANAVSKEFHGNANIFSLIDAFHRLDEKTKEPAKAFISRLESLAELSCIHTESGFSLENAIEEGMCVYIVGSTSDLNVRFLQQILFARCIQNVMKREANREYRQLLIMVDEIRYCLSPYVVDSLGTVRSKKCHLLLAHQSEGDFAAVQGKDFQSVRTAIMDNISLRWIYRATNAESAERASKETGLIRATTADRKALAVENNEEVMSGDVNIRETQRYAFDANTMLSLPEGMAVVVGLPKEKNNARSELIYTHHIEYSPSTIALPEAPALVRQTLDTLLQPAPKAEPHSPLSAEDFR